jgi:pimeloyl-ACP methyl ester carboxylesterase
VNQLRSAAPVLLALGTIVFGMASPPPSQAATAPAQSEPEHAHVTMRNGRGLQLRFAFTNAVSTTPVSGRLVLGFHRDPTHSVDAPDPLHPQPTFAWDVHGWKPGEPLVLDGSNATRWNEPLDSLSGWYSVQAGLKLNPRARALESAGNAFTSRNVVYIERGEMCQPLDLLFTAVAPAARRLADAELIKYVTIQSRLLTDFYGEPDSIAAAVVLPRNYLTDSTRSYPTVYVLGGFGSSLYDVKSGTTVKRYGMDGVGEEKVFVVVHHECRSGYHVFCSSETNGPREETFLQELIPFVEARYRVQRDPRMRFLMGQSSGAWAGLWLLLRHPDQFGGAYVAAPDPVDFTDFIGTNLYEPGANLFVDAAGEPKRLSAGKSRYGSFTPKDIVALDRIAGWGEQMYSFDAAFSRRGSDGHPRRLFDWETGKVDPEVAASWRPHDLTRVVSGMDRKRSAALQGKIHVYVAEDDDFGLNRPVRTFKRALEAKKIAADVQFWPSGGHILWSDSLRKVIHDDMDGAIRARARPK